MGEYEEYLGCPSCGTEDLNVAEVCYEPVTFTVDGGMNMNEGIYDYGGIFKVFCSHCNWSMGSDGPETITARDFVNAHAELIRQEFIKEAAKP